MAGAVAAELIARLLDATRVALLEHLLEPLDEQVPAKKKIFLFFVLKEDSLLQLPGWVAARMAELPAPEVEGALQPEGVSARLLEQQCRLEQEAALAAERVRVFASHIQDF